MQQKIAAKNSLLIELRVVADAEVCIPVQTVVICGINAAALGKVRLKYHTGLHQPLPLKQFQGHIDAVLRGVQIVEEFVGIYPGVLPLLHDDLFHRVGKFR